MFDFDFDTNDFDGFDNQPHDGSYDTTHITDFPTTDSTDFGSEMSGTNMEFPHPESYPGTDPLTSSDFGLEDFGKHETSFEGDNHGSNSNAVQQLDFRPDHNGQDNYHHIAHHNDVSQNEISFRGEHTAGERSAAISKAKHDIAAAESDIRHHTSIANSKARMGEPHSAEDSAIRSANSRLADAKRALNDAYNMKVKS